MGVYVLCWWGVVFQVRCVICGVWYCSDHGLMGIVVRRVGEYCFYYIV